MKVSGLKLCNIAICKTNMAAPSLLGDLARYTCRKSKWITGVLYTGLSPDTITVESICKREINLKLHLDVADVDRQFFTFLVWRNCRPATVGG